MRAYIVNSYAHPSKLPLTENASEPKPGKGEVVVEIYSAALNFFDVSSIVIFVCKTVYKVNVRQDTTSTG
jgi:NADPH:quinone reductase-like Zn-dependent oxidoreductase